jgi:glyoxylase-like metal-dependent hydrolase (beta-lactamase superfamily II)
MKTIHVVSVVLLCFIFLSDGPAQDLDQVQIETIHVRDGTYMLTGGGGNIGVLVGEDGILLIDDQFAELEEKIKAAISKLNKGPIRFVLNTNWHYDHVSGNAVFAKSGATIIAHEKTRERMATEQFHRFFDMRIPPYPKPALPVITFADSLTLHFSGEELHAFHIEGAHSDADLAFHFRNANVLHTGDLYFSHGFPFIDSNHGGAVDGMIAAAGKLIAMMDEDTKVIPGHGPLSNREEMREFRDMLVTVRDRIAKQIEAGNTLEEITASKPTAGFDEGRTHGMSAEQFVRNIYNELAE